MYTCVCVYRPGRTRTRSRAAQENEQSEQQSNMELERDDSAFAGQQNVSKSDMGDKKWSCTIETNGAKSLGAESLGGRLGRKKGGGIFSGEVFLYVCFFCDLQVN